MTKTRKTEPPIPTRQAGKKHPSDTFANLRPLPHPAYELLGIAPPESHAVNQNQHDSVNQPTQPSVNPTSQDLVNHISHLTSQLAAAPVNQPDEPQVNQPPEQNSIQVNQPHELPVNQPAGTPVNQIEDHSVNQTYPTSVNQSSLTTVNQTIDETVNQDAAQSVNQATENPVNPTGSLVNMLTTSEPHVVNKLTKTKKAVNQEQKTVNQIGAAVRRDGTKIKGFRLKVETIKDIEHFCVEHGFNQQDFADLAFNHFIEHVVNQKHADVVNGLTHDDLMIYKTHDDIIMLYSNLTGNRWKPADDRCAVQFNDADRRLIEIGILNTLLNAKGKKINSFAYFIPEIDECLTVNLGDETIEIMLPRRRSQWNGLKAKKR
jgi:hypothetical protein